MRYPVSDADEFDAIVNNQPDDPADDDGELADIWEAVSHMWPHFYDGMLIKGVLVVEYVDPEDGGRVLRFISSPDCAPWDTLGMLESARQDARDLSRHSNVYLDEDEDEE